MLSSVRRGILHQNCEDPKDSNGHAKRGAQEKGPRNKVIVID